MSGHSLPRLKRIHLQEYVLSFDHDSRVHKTVIGKWGLRKGGRAGVVLLSVCSVHHRNEVVSERRDWLRDRPLLALLGSWLCVLSFLSPALEDCSGSLLDRCQTDAMGLPGSRTAWNKFFPSLITPSKVVCYRGRMQATTTCMGTILP